MADYLEAAHAEVQALPAHEQTQKDEPHATDPNSPLKFPNHDSCQSYRLGR